ncbi:MAG: type II toxin-antitoxin system death-on-curing family toxin [Pseudomonadota bacterium]
MSKAPAWLDKRALLLLHQESLAQFGGAVGLRDEGLLDSALARPVNKYSHDGCKDLAVLAAAYGYGLARNHPFVDGNKRAAFLAVGVFLAINGQRLTAKPIEAIEAILSLAAGSMEEARFADWVRR